MERREALRLAVGATLATVTLSAVSGVERVAHAAAEEGIAANLDNRQEDWQIFIDPPGRRAAYVKDNVADPSRDGRALRLGLRGGDPYTGVQGYYTFPPMPQARAFELSLWWRFPATTFDNTDERGAFAPSLVQNVQLTYSTWKQGLRREIAMQYMVVHDDSPDGRPCPAWRLWDGRSWRTTGITQYLSGDTWHYFQVRGEETPDGRVRYVSFTSDDLTAPLGHTYNPISIVGDQVTIAFQADGNFRQDPYDVLFDQVSFRWFASSPW